MYGWGAGAQGETGLGEFIDSHIPKQCVPYQRPHKNVSFAKQPKESFQVPEDKIIQICAGGHHSMILTESGRIYGFGQAAAG